MGDMFGTNRKSQGSYKFLSLAMGKKVTRRKFTEMPITESVIDQVEKMAVKDGATKGLSFKNRSGDVIEILDDDEEEAINESVREEVLMKLEPDQEEEVLQDAVKTVGENEPRRLARARIANRQ